MRGGIFVFALALVAAGCGVSSNETEQNRSPQQVTLRVTTSGNGLVRGAGADCRSTCSAQYAKGSQVHLTAVADAGSSFSGWSGACSGTGACDLNLDADRGVTATFAGSPPAQHRLTVVVQGQGRVTSRPAGLACDSATCNADFADGSSIALDAVPATGFSFDGWGAGCSGSGGCTLTLSSDRTVYANFTAQKPPPPPPQVHLVASVTGPGTVTGGGLDCGESTKTCDVTLDGGSAVTLTASPAGRTRFTGWGGACSGTATSCQLTVNADTKVSAEFQSEVMVLAPGDGTNIYPVMALNSTRVFWPRWSNGSSAIWSMPKKGGEAVRVVAASVTAMVADDAYLYWTDQYNLYSTPVGGGEVAQLASAWPIQKLALDEVGALYWTVAAGTSGNAGAVHRMQNRADAVIAANQSAASVAVDADFAYFATFNSSGIGALRRVPRNGGKVESLVDCPAQCFVYGVRVDSDHLYWREAYSGKVFARDKKTGAVRNVAEDAGKGSEYAADLAINGGVVYWNRIAGVGPVYGIFRVNADGTGFGAVDSSNDATWYGLAVDDSAVYYFHAGAIIRRLK